MPERPRGPERLPEEGASPPRLWQVPEAEQELRKILPALRELRTQVGRLADMKEQLERMAAVWGEEFDAPDHPDAAKKKELEAQLKTLYGRVEEEMTEWKERGIEVKDLSRGILDFVAMRKGEIVLLCWKEGEEGIRFWHTLDGGFRARRPLSPEERDGGLDSLPHPRKKDPSPDA